MSVWLGKKKRKRKKRRKKKTKGDTNLRLLKPVTRMEFVTNPASLIVQFELEVKGGVVDKERIGEKFGRHFHDIPAPDAVGDTVHHKGSLAKILMAKVGSSGAGAGGGGAGGAGGGAGAGAGGGAGGGGRNAKG